MNIQIDTLSACLIELSKKAIYGYEPFNRLKLCGQILPLFYSIYYQDNNVPDAIAQKILKLTQDNAEYLIKSDLLLTKENFYELFPDNIAITKQIAHWIEEENISIDQQNRKNNKLISKNGIKELIKEKIHLDYDSYIIAYESGRIIYSDKETNTVNAVCSFSRGEGFVSLGIQISNPHVLIDVGSFYGQSQSRFWMNCKNDLNDLIGRGIDIQVALLNELIEKLKTT